MNPRQRRGILLLLATAVGAVMVFLAIAAYTRSVSTQVGPLTSIVRLTEPVTELQVLTPEMVELAEVPERWVSASAMTSLQDIEGMVAAATYDSGVTLQTGMLRQPPGLQPGYREVAIMVDAETGVAGKVTPGTRVDIIATTIDEATERQSSEIWVSNALVIEVGVPRAVEDEDTQGNFTEGEGVPVTFALASADALRLAYAESFAVKLRLALRGAGDLEQLPSDQSVYDQDMPVLSGALPAGVPAGAAARQPAPAPEATADQPAGQPTDQPADQPAPVDQLPPDQPADEPAEEGQP